jgi:HSP20 family protein
MYEPLFRFPTDVFAEFDQIQRAMEQVLGPLGMPASIRAVARGTFPTINIGTTPTSIEVFAFAPGIDPAKLELTVDRGVLTVAGERARELPEESDKVSVYARERPAGPFKRVLSLPEDADPMRMEARYRDGVLRVSIQRRAPAQPKAIEIK